MLWAMGRYNASSLDRGQVEELEHAMRRGISIRANLDMDYEEYDIRSTTLEDLEQSQIGFRRAQVLECNVRRSAFENTNKTIGWTDNGYFVELLDGEDYIGHRAKACLQDIRRSFAVGDVILPSSAQGGRQ